MFLKDEHFFILFKTAAPLRRITMAQQLTREQQIAEIQKIGIPIRVGKGIKRNYTAEDVVRLRGSLPVEHTLAKRGSKNFGISSIMSHSSMHWAR